MVLHILFNVTKVLFESFQTEIFWNLKNVYTLFAVNEMHFILNLFKHPQEIG